MPHVTVMTGPERRRRWSDEDRRQILVAAFTPGAVVADVSREYDVSTSLIYKWRREVADSAAEHPLQRHRHMSAGGTQPVALNAVNGFQVILTGLPQGAICTITEQPPVVPSELTRRCRWETTYPGGQKAEITDRRGLTLKVINQWVCGKAT